MTYDDLCKTMHPADYAAGRGLSEAGEKVARLLEEAEAREPSEDPAADSGWGYLGSEALAEDEAQWRHLLHEGKL